MSAGRGLGLEGQKLPTEVQEVIKGSVSSDQGSWGQ